MTDRFKSIFTVLLAMLLCVASSQAAVCELSCGLESQDVACHMAEVPQPAAMQEVPHGHCSRAMSSTPAMNDTGRIMSSLPATGCGHSLLAAVESSAGWKAHGVDGQSWFLLASFIDQVKPHHTSIADRGSPPLRDRANHLIVTLRI